MRRTLLRVVGRDDPVEVGLERGAAGPAEHTTVSVDGRKLDVEVERRSRSSGWMRLHGRIVPFSAVHVDGAVEVWLGGRRYRFEIVQRTARRAAGEAGAPTSAELTAPMPGTVLKVNASPGDAFEAHDAIVVIESMKMEMALSSPRSGRISEILCEVGELVEMGAVLARIEPVETTE